MSLGTRLLRELEDADNRLARVMRTIDDGTANMTDIRRELAAVRADELRELDRLIRQAKHNLATCARYSPAG